MQIQKGWTVVCVRGLRGKEEEGKNDGKSEVLNSFIRCLLHMYIQLLELIGTNEDVPLMNLLTLWNKGTPPKPGELGLAMPARIRVKKSNSQNKRFKMDPLIKNRAVLELDDDILMSCSNIERGFRVWREHPDRIVGFYPRLVGGSVLKYDGEKYARRLKGYNMILTGAAFMDAELAFGRYWSKEAEAGRRYVDKHFNCEDVLLNYLYSNASRTRTVEYVRPSWRIDTSKLSGVAISRNTQAHYRTRSRCLSKFSKIYGGRLENRKWGFDGRGDRWDM